MLTPYQYASNTPIQAIDLDGLEAFFIHGTAACPSRCGKRVRAFLTYKDRKNTKQFKRLTGNKFFHHSSKPLEMLGAVYLDLKSDGSVYVVEWAKELDTKADCNQYKSTKTIQQAFFDAGFVLKNEMRFGEAGLYLEYGK